MKIYQINGGVFGSTGKIMFGIARVARAQGHEVRCASPVTSTNRNREPKEQYYHIGSYYGRCLSVLMARITGLEGCFSVLSTWRLLRDMETFDPDVVHLHSIHNSCLNLPMLFRWMKKRDVKIIWMLHDCWAFTGHCSHFALIGCEKWKTGCNGCPQYGEYPKSYRDNARTMYGLKKSWFTGLKDLTIVAASNWLTDLVKASFLREYPVEVMPYGIDLKVFRPAEGDFRKKYRCEDKNILLGVAFGWGLKKGLDVFVELAKRLDDRYQIVLVGTDEDVDQQLPENVISIHRTQNQKELAEIYTAADVFVNPTREETFGLVNVEALACGTPVITFRTGGSPESLDATCGRVVEQEDIEGLEREIRDICENTGYTQEACITRASVFEQYKNFSEVISLYQK